MSSQEEQTTRRADDGSNYQFNVDNVEYKETTSEPSPSNTVHGETPSMGKSKTDTAPGAFRRKFVNDFPKGMGMGPETDIWTRYLEFVTVYDREMLDTLNFGMENLLVFAALLSGIVTAFLMMSLQLLLPDTSRATLDALTTVSAQLAALGTSGSSMPSGYQAAGFTIPANALYINALWIVSLFISLSVSVLAMLVKEWLRVYGTEWPSTPREHAHYRQFRWDGLCKWKVPSIAKSLPLLLQTSVALFFAGLLVYLWGISHELRWLLMFVFILGGLGYVGLALAGLVWIDCPYKSPLTSGLDIIWCYSHRVLALLLSSNLPEERRYHFDGRIRFLVDYWFKMEFKESLKRYIPSVLWISLIRKRVQEWISIHQESLDERAVSWFSKESYDLSTAKSVVNACFSSHQFKTFQEKNRSAIRSAALRCLRPGAGDTELTSWDAIKQKLTEAAMARTFVDWAHVGDPSHAWYNRLWTLPSDQVPTADRFLYYALLVTCAGPYPRCRPELRRSVRGCIKMASNILIATLGKDGGNLSSLGCWLFSFYLTNALSEDGDEFWCDIVESLRSPMLDELATSASLPIEVLFSFVELRRLAEKRASGHFVALRVPSEVWIPSLPTEDKYSFFYHPMVASIVHGELEIASLRYATNELKSRSPNSLLPEDGIKWILAWFEANGYLRSSPDRIRANAKVELDFLQACREAQAEKDQCDIWNSDLITICQLLDIETDSWNHLELSGGRVEYYYNFDTGLKDLLQNARNVEDSRGLVIGLVLASQGLFAGPYMQRSLNVLLSSLQICDIAEVILTVPSRCDHLCRILLYWLYRKAPFGSAVIALVHRLERLQEHNNLSDNQHFRKLMNHFKRQWPNSQEENHPSHAHTWSTDHGPEQTRAHRRLHQPAPAHHLEGSVDGEQAHAESILLNARLVGMEIEPTLEAIDAVPAQFDGTQSSNLQHNMDRTGELLQLPILNRRETSTEEDQIEDEKETLRF